MPGWLPKTTSCVWGLGWGLCFIMLRRIHWTVANVHSQWNKVPQYLREEIISFLCLKKYFRDSCFKNGIEYFLRRNVFKLHYLISCHVCLLLNLLILHFGFSVECDISHVLYLYFFKPKISLWLLCVIWNIVILF